MSTEHTALTFLKTTTPWFGGHTGYEPLPSHIRDNPKMSVIQPRSQWFDRCVGKAISLRRGYGHASQVTVAALKRFERVVSQKNTLGHILYGEDFIRFAHKMPRRILDKTLFTFHQPPSNWKPNELDNLVFVKRAMFLYRKDLDFFSNRLGYKPSFALLGVDTTFFTPGIFSSPRRILYNGVHLRNFAMFMRLAQRILDAFPDLQIDALVPMHRRGEPEFKILLEHPKISWHAGLDDRQLLRLYQGAYLLLLPMNDSGANTAVVEALACGLPIVTTDVGGIRDYGGDQAFPLIENNDDHAMFRLVSKYLCDIDFRENTASACRAFAERYLAWGNIVGQHLKIYQSLLS